MINQEFESNDETTQENISDMLQYSTVDGEYDGRQTMCIQLMQHPILPREEETRLFDIIQNGSSGQDLLDQPTEGRGSTPTQKLDARNTLLVHNQRLVYSVAKRYKWSGCLTIEDLVQEGAIGLIKV